MINPNKTNKVCNLVKIFVKIKMDGILFRFNHNKNKDKFKI